MQDTTGGVRNNDEMVHTDSHAKKKLEMLALPLTRAPARLAPNPYAV